MEYSKTKSAYSQHNRNIAKRELYEVTKKPENSKVYRIHIEKMLRKHHKEFVSGEFKERLAYEI